MKLRTHPPRTEMREAAAYYERQEKGLGEAFLDEVDKGVLRIRSMPELYPHFRGEIRRHSISRFPYGILYRILHGRIEVVAVAHLRRRPDHWHYRE